jgi:hypothetical protein
VSEEKRNVRNMWKIKSKWIAIIDILFNKKFYLVTYNKDNEVKHRQSHNINEDNALYAIQGRICTSCGKEITIKDFVKKLYMKVGTDNLIHWNCEDQELNKPSVKTD